jgi:RNA polymerase sigma-70 factor (ECF subfamily)
MVRTRKDRADFEVWFRGLYPSALRVGLRLLGNASAAEDAVSDAFCRALIKWELVGGLAYRDAWLLRVVANVSIDQVRRRRGISLAPSGHQGREDDAVILRLALVAALRGLPKRQREAIALHYLAGLTTAEVASYMDISAESVKEHISRGTSRLRDRLGAEWKESDLAFH